MAGVLSAEMLQGLDVRTYAPGSRIYTKGDAASHAFLIVKGTVALIATGTDGKNAALGQLGPGQIFGETAMLTKGKRNTHAIAVVETACAAIDESFVSQLLAKADPFMRYWIEFMSGRLTELYSRIAAKGAAKDAGGS